ncbi:MAG: TrbI F-type domain-containing protein [Sphingorhabdus sp.]|uniref:TrbI F-type domain-containing protein n=1 Tax=Sphingorhabdus sp. TaxID=1902408 RepID=UPI003CAF43B0
MASHNKPDTAGGVGPLFSEAAAARNAVAPRSSINWLPVAVVSTLVATGLWGAWVTREIIAKPEATPMARIQLSSMVGEYVQAQARSATPPDQVTAETKAFMAEIEKNLKARGADGQIVLVGEAVLAGDVPDITAEVRKQVFAKVRMPEPAPQAAHSVMGAMQQAMADPGLAAPGNAGMGYGPRN